MPGTYCSASTIVFTSRVSSCSRVTTEIDCGVSSIGVSVLVPAELVLATKLFGGLVMGDSAAASLEAVGALTGAGAGALTCLAADFVAAFFLAAFGFAADSTCSGGNGTAPCFQAVVVAAGGGVGGGLASCACAPRVHTTHDTAAAERPRKRRYIGRVPPGQRWN